MSNRILRSAVIGAGHMGRHHCRIYSELPETELVAVVDSNVERAREFAEKYRCKFSDKPEDIVDEIDIASIAVPTRYHLPLAKYLIQKGKAVLIEKPLAPDSRQANEILDLARSHNVIVQVGHTERFNPVVQALARLNVTPRFIETHRISPFTFRSADIGVVFDMMIHDIDIVLSLTRKKIVKVDAVGVPVLGEHEDIANARLTFEDGCVANLTSSRLALKTERKIRVFSPQAYISLDYQKKSGIAIKKDDNLDILNIARNEGIENLAQLAGSDYANLVKVEPLMITDEEPLKAEILDFVNAVKNSAQPKVPVSEGVLAVETAERIVKAVNEHNWKL